MAYVAKRPTHACTLGRLPRDARRRMRGGRRSSAGAPGAHLIEWAADGEGWAEQCRVGEVQGRAWRRPLLPQRLVPAVLLRRRPRSSSNVGAHRRVAADVDADLAA
jgi:hypothetical protein